MIACFAHNCWPYPQATLEEGVSVSNKCSQLREPAL